MSRVAEVLQRPCCVLQLLAVACLMLAAQDLEEGPSSSSSELMAAAVAYVAGMRLARHAAAWQWLFVVAAQCVAC